MQNISFYSLIYGLALFSGFSYLIGFWIPFRFNFVEHIDISSIIKISALSLIPVLVSMLIGAGLGSVASLFHTEQSINEGLPASNRKKNRTLLIIFRTAFVFICLISAPFLFSSLMIERLLGAFPIASIIGVAYLTQYPGPLRPFHPAIKSTVITIICLFPTAALYTGYIQGEESYNDESKGYLLTGTERCSSNDKIKYRYLAASGDKILTLSLDDKSICISGDKSFSLTPHTPKPSPTSSGPDHFISRYIGLPPINRFIGKS